MILIGLSGKKRSGKNTAAKIISLLTSSTVEEFAFADELKKDVARICQVTVKELEENKPLYRGLLQAWGVYKRQKVDEDYWVKIVINKLLKSKSDIAVVTDVRFKNEAEVIRKAGGIVVRVNRGIEGDDSHVSETELDGYKFDYIIDNNSTLNNLSENIRMLMNSLKLPIKNK